MLTLHNAYYHTYGLMADEKGPLVPLERLVEIMRRLRDPTTGCEWDSVQTFETIAPYTIEEAYEVADAIARDDMDALADELGDLQLQVVFHARMAEEAGHVHAGRRHRPHLRQDGAPPPAHLRRCRRRRSSPVGKHQGRGTRRERRQKRARRGRAGACRRWSAPPSCSAAPPGPVSTGPTSAGPRAKIDEELAELEAETEHERKLEEMGDLLFAVVNLARHLNIDPEAALREANRKFEARFRAIEAEPGFAAMSLDEMEALWVRAKGQAQSA